MGEIGMDNKKVEDLAFRVVSDMGGAFTMVHGYVGDRLGIFKAMAGAGPLTRVALAERVKLNKRYVREWANAMVAAESLDYDPTSGRYIMTEEQACVLELKDGKKSETRVGIYYLWIILNKLRGFF